MDGDHCGDEADRPIGGRDPEELEDVLASIRALVTAETASRLPHRTGGAVLMLTEDMRVDADGATRSGQVLADGIAAGLDRSTAAPILDEEALRGVVNTIVREELQGELGDRISRNLRKLIRRELAQMIDERRGSGD